MEPIGSTKPLGILKKVKNSLMIMLWQTIRLRTSPIAFVSPANAEAQSRDTETYPWKGSNNILAFLPHTYNKWQKSKCNKTDNFHLYFMSTFLSWHSPTKTNSIFQIFLKFFKRLLKSYFIN